MTAAQEVRVSLRGGGCTGNQEMSLRRIY